MRTAVTINPKMSSTNQQDSQRTAVYCIEYQPHLVEEALLRAIAGHAKEKIFRLERNAIYRLPDQEAREEAFQTLHQRWFERIGLHEPIEAVLNTWPHLKAQTQRCLLVKASGKKEMGAELFVAEDDSQALGGSRSVVIQVTPDLLLRTEVLYNFLRRELLHVVDMLDPEFGYEPYLPKSEIGPTYDRLLQERYRILWNLTIDGRLSRANFLPVSVKEKHWQIFANTFPGHDQDLQKVFTYFFHSASPKHKELVSFSLSPETWFDRTGPESEPKGMCPLCHFPSFHLVETKSLPANTFQKIKEEHPHWQPQQKICRQCADLYELRTPIGFSS